MFRIRELFERYKHIQPPESSVRKAVVSVLAQYKIIVPERSVRVIGTVVYLDTDPVVKSVVFIHKNKILSEVTESIGKEGMIKDIR